MIISCCKQIRLTTASCFEKEFLISKHLLKYHDIESNVDAYETDNNNPLMIVPLDFTHNLKVICIHAIII